MVNWNYNASDYEEKSFKPIPIGDHRVRIADAVEKTSRSGNEMVELTLEVSGYSGKLWYYLVFLADNVKMTNKKIGSIFDSFGIQQGNMDIKTWIGKVGAARVAHEEYNGENQPKIKYFISKSRQDSLPAWVEPDNRETQTTGISTNIPGKDIPFNDADLPF